MFFVFAISIYMYYLIAQFYHDRTKKSLTNELIQNGCKNNIQDLLEEAINTTPFKYQAKISGVPKNYASGIIFGKTEHDLLITSPETEEGHVFCIGGTSAGKTSALLIPTLRTYKGNVFVIDISGDIIKNVHRPNALILNPHSLDSLPYNVFYQIDNESDPTEQLEQINQLAYLLMPDEPDMGDNGSFFAYEGRKMLKACLIHYYYKNMDFTDICREIVSTEATDLLNEIWASENEDTRPLISSFRGTNEKNTGGCKQAMDKSITFFATNKNVRRILRRPKDNENSITPFSMEHNDVFIEILEKKLNIYAPLLSIIIVQMFEYLSDRPSSKTTSILFALDEFAWLGKIDIVNALRTLRKRHVRIMLLTQSFADLDDIYGPNKRKIMLDNCAYKVIFKANDPETQDFASRLIGEHNACKMTYNWSTNYNGYSKSTQKERIIEPAAFAYLGDEMILLCPTGYMRLHKNNYYEY